MAYQFYNLGGKKLYIDEIHKYKDWSREVKIYTIKFLVFKVSIQVRLFLIWRKVVRIKSQEGRVKITRTFFSEYLNISQGWAASIVFVGRDSCWEG